MRPGTSEQKRMRRCLVIGFLACSALPAASQEEQLCITPYTAFDGYDTAQGLQRLSDHNLASYVRGFVNGILISTATGAPETCVDQLKKRCLTGRNDQQLAAILRKYLVEHPEEWHWSANIVSWKALFVPCRGP
jgi:hypothetical protein